MFLVSLPFCPILISDVIPLLINLFSFLLESFKSVDETLMCDHSNESV